MLYVNFRMKFFLVFLCFRKIRLNSAQPDNFCPSDQPFKLNDLGCGNFHDVCYKNNDEQCKQLQYSCKQCPPSNITIQVLGHILNRITELEIKSKESQSIDRNSSENRYRKIIGIINQKFHTATATVTILIILIILIIIIAIVLFIFKHKLEFVKNYRRAKKYRLSKKFNIEQGNLLLPVDLSTQTLAEKEQILNILKELMGQLPTKSTDITFCTIQFHLDGIDYEPIELYVHHNHNIVQVKQQICAKLPNAKHDDYKIMKLKYNGNILNDDNQYLLEYIDKSNTIVNCFIDSSMNASDIVVVKLQGKMRLPDIIQINKNQTIDQLKELIGKIINSKDFTLFKQSNESIKIEELKDNLNSLFDGYWIRIVTKEFGKLIIRSIFDDEDSITIEFVNVDIVSSLMTSISNKYNWDLNNFVLFYNNKYLEAGKYIFEYQISSESAVKYCCFIKWAGINMVDDDYINKGNFSELRYGTFEKSDRKILIKKYEVKSSKTWKDEEFMLKELITFQITKSHRRFIQLFGVYIDDAILYVVMENMDGGTLKTFLQENYEKLDKNKIYKLSAQILEGLKFLHENKVIHRDLNPSSILVDENEDLKLSSFNLSKYLDIHKPCSIMAKGDKKEDLPVRYMAPEILNGDKYGEACDVWSFGAVLIRIVTNRKPYPYLTKSEALNQISNLKMIEYKLPNKYSEFKSIIDSCLKYDPSLRVKIGKLIDDENINEYINEY